MAEPRHAPLSFRPAPHVARDEEFDDSLFDRAAGGSQAPRDEPEPEDPAPVREGLPSTYRMRHDTHYVDQIASRRHAEPVLLVPIGHIDGPHPVHAPHELQPLVESIAQVGMLQPLLVRRQNGRYELIAGAARLAAAVAAGLTEVPCLVHSADEDRARTLATASAVTGRRPGRPDEGEPQAAIPAAVFNDITEHLGAIGACLHLFGDRDRPLRERVAMELVQAEVQRAAWLSQALAVLVGDPALVCNPVDLDALVQRLLSMLTPERVLAGVAVDYECGVGRAVVRGDEQLLAVAVAGLISGMHALVERAPDARVRVRVSAPPAEGRALVEVTQAAVHLPAAWRARFFDLAWPDRPGGASAGAGLVAARRVAALHGGDVRLTAAGREGCSVVLELPARESNQ